MFSVLHKLPVCSVVFRQNFGAQCFIDTSFNKNLNKKLNNLVVVKKSFSSDTHLSRNKLQELSTMACKIDLEFYNGLKMPALGLGTWQAPDAEVERALNEALEAGYRHIDAAPVYMNEKTIGRVLKEWIDSGKLSRNELFITTKLPPPGNRPSSVEKYLRRSLEDLQLDYVDLYLIHTPFTLADTDGELKREADGSVVLETTTDHIATWKVMEEMLAAGLTKSIGVSNFNQRQLQKLLNNCKVKPVNLQIENHLYLQQKELVDFCKANQIIVTAYSPLGSKGIATLLKNCGIDREIPDLMENPVVKKIASHVNKSPAQVLLRYLLERGLSAIPKSTNFNRLKQNMDVFDFTLDADDMKALAELDQGVRVCDFAFFKGIENHPEFPF